jgi:hypothetical protein
MAFSFPVMGDLCRGTDPGRGPGRGPGTDKRASREFYAAGVKFAGGASGRHATGLEWISLALWGHDQPSAAAPCSRLNGCHRNRSRVESDKRIAMARPRRLLVLAVHVKWQDDGTLTGLVAERILELIFAEHVANFSRRPHLPAFG